MKEIHTSELQTFVNLVDNKYGGNLNDPELLALYPLKLIYDAQVNDNLDPFSDEYYSQQLTLYEEISGRSLNQTTGELHPVDVERLSIAPNPLGINNTSVIAPHIRSIAGLLNICNLGINPKILDMGAGHGLSSELYAFAGAEVHAIDIDSTLGRLASDRAKARHLNITRTTLNFDDISSLDCCNFDAAFFYQSLHHCLKPWLLISALKEKLSANATIGFAGEPLNSPWWNTWGLRLDHESLYVAKKFGWFESGWSAAFIKECFARNDYHLNFYNGGHFDGEIGVASLNKETLNNVWATARRSGVKRLCDGSGNIAAEGSYSSEVGVIAVSPFEGNFFQTAIDFKGKGFLCYGPYAPLKQGNYKFRIYLEKLTINEVGMIQVDIIHGQGATILYSENFCFDADIFSQFVGVTIVRDFELKEDVLDLEVRVFIENDSQLLCSSPKILLR